MFSKRYQSYALVGLILIGWSSLIETRNLGNPRVQHVTLENEGLHSVVKCDVWNPRYEDIYVMALVRLVKPGDPEVGRKAVATAYNIIKSRIAPRSHLAIKERLKGYGDWPQADVQVFLIIDPAQIKKIAAAESLKKRVVQ